MRSGGSRPAPKAKAKQPSTQKPAPKPNTAKSASKQPASSKNASAKQPLPNPSPSSATKSKPPPGKANANHATPQLSLPQQPFDDSDITLTAEESDRLFDEVDQLVSSGLGNIPLNPESDSTNNTATQPQGSSQANSSGSFKGFGFAPNAARTTTAPAASKGSAGVPHSSSGPASVRAHGSHAQAPPLRVFLYGTERDKTNEALKEAGWSSQVVVSEDLRSANAVVAAKMGQNNKHNKLQQSERTAANAGVPFVCVGRNMTRDNLVIALAPVLMAHRAQYSSAPEGGVNTLMEEAGVSLTVIQQRAAVNATKLEAGWKERSLRMLGLGGPVASQPNTKPAEVEPEVEPGLIQEAQPV